MPKELLVVILLHSCVYFAAASNETSALLNSSSVVSETISTPPSTILNLPGIGTTPENVTLSLSNQGDGTRKTVPRKGTPKDPVKGRKGAEPTDTSYATSIPTPGPKFKPLASEAVRSEDEVSDPPSHQTALIVGLSLGIAMVLILAAVTFWRLRDVWERRQYKRVDFLIDGMYTDT